MLIVLDRWGVVAAPHDVTGPPIDLVQLVKQQELQDQERYEQQQNQQQHQYRQQRDVEGKKKKSLGMAALWADGECAFFLIILPMRECVN